MNSSVPIIRILQNTLNHVDPRLMDHGKRVAYLVYRVMREDGIQDDQWLHDTAVLSLLHDVGAYKTEEIDNMVQFETNTVWEHSIYGYLFIRHFSPLSSLAESILYHHAPCVIMADLPEKTRHLAQMIYVSDRLDILHLQGRIDEAWQHFNRHRGILFDSEMIDRFFVGKSPIRIEEMDQDKEFEQILYNMPVSEEEIEAYVRMIVLSIDFRSPQTVTHSLASTSACHFLAKKLRFNQQDRDLIDRAAMLHDLGKICIPIQILEKAGRLDDQEMACMKKHVSVTRSILDGLANPVIVRLASRHHEKLNGSGYPDGLFEQELTPGERLIAVTDIFSALFQVRSYKPAYPKEKVIDILNQMARSQELDPEIVHCCVEHYDLLVEEVNRKTAPIAEHYRQLKAEYTELLEQMTQSEI